MKIYTVCLLACLSLCAKSAFADDVKDFPDVPKTHWAYEAVTDLHQRGILLGYPAEPTHAKHSEKHPHRFIPTLRYSVVDLEPVNIRTLNDNRLSACTSASSGLFFSNHRWQMQHCLDF